MPLLFDIALEVWKLAFTCNASIKELSVVRMHERPSFTTTIANETNGNIMITVTLMIVKRHICE